MITIINTNDISDLKKCFLNFTNVTKKYVIFLSLGESNLIIKKTFKTWIKTWHYQESPVTQNETVARKFLETLYLKKVILKIWSFFALFPSWNLLLNIEREREKMVPFLRLLLLRGNHQKRNSYFSRSFFFLFMNLCFLWLDDASAHFMNRERRERGRDNNKKSHSWHDNSLGLSFNYISNVGQ